jgi:acylphosphatase
MAYKDHCGMTVCKHAYYSGRVQGVGFRFTAQHVAEGFAVAGFVRNLPDGTVEVLAEGPAEQVNGFLSALNQRMTEYIEEVRVEEESTQGVRGFRVKY